MEASQRRTSPFETGEADHFFRPLVISQSRFVGRLRTKRLADETCNSTNGACNFFHSRKDCCEPLPTGFQERLIGSACASPSTKHSKYFAASLSFDFSTTLATSISASAASSFLSDNGPDGSWPVYRCRNVCFLRKHQVRAMPPRDASLCT